MKNLVLFSVVITSSLTGCSLFEARDIARLQKRVTILENRQSVKTSQTERFGGKASYVQPAESDKSKTESRESVTLSKKEIQTALKNAGYYTGPIDGKLGTKSRKAVREFQTDNNLKVDGIAGSGTQKALVGYLTK